MDALDEYTVTPSKSCHNLVTMNILYCDRFGTESLDATHVYEILSNLSRLGHNVIVLYKNSPMLRAGAGAGAKPSFGKRIRARLRSTPLYKSLEGEIMLSLVFWREIRIFISAFVLILKRRKDIDVIYRRHNLFNSEHILSGLFRIPSVKEVAGIISDETKTRRQGDRVSLWVITAVEKFNMPGADRLIAVTSKLKDVLRDDYRVPEDRIAVIWNGANTDLFKPMDAGDAREQLGLSQSESYVCYIGSLTQWQGVEHLINSAPLVLAEFPETRFLIVGDGIMREELVALAKHSGVSDRVIFVGFVPYEQVPRYINASDVCVAPFVSNERSERTGLSPLKLCEYMACGKPVVTSAISGLEIVESSTSGILVAPGDHRELASAILKLLRTPELRKKMGENGRKYVVENRSWESVARKLGEVFQQAVQERRGKHK